MRKVVDLKKEEEGDKVHERVLTSALIVNHLVHLQG